MVLHVCAPHHPPEMCWCPDDWCHWQVQNQGQPGGPAWGSWRNWSPSPSSWCFLSSWKPLEMTAGTLDRTSNKSCYRETEAHSEKWELSARNQHQSPAATQHQPSGPGFPRGHTQPLPIWLSKLLPRVIPAVGVLHPYSGMPPPVTVMGSGFPSSVPRRNVELGDTKPITCPQNVPCWEKEIRLTG